MAAFDAALTLVPVPAPLEPLRKYIGLSPSQFQALQRGHGVAPDPYSGRFGLRDTPEEALNRGYTFNTWEPPSKKRKQDSVENDKENLEQMANPEDGDPKKYVIVELNVTDLGFRWLSMESRLHFNREGQLRLYGALFNEVRDADGRLLYQVGEHVQQPIS
ncbi:unnamed protein product [Durusdinium trenchii]|uniref:Uncharacterized protein n=2 Tax=Durusdinium trenchii TaxID=1381693 RepID=A0ABP0HVF3_9DINO